MELLLYSTVQRQQVTDNLSTYSAANGGAYFAFGLYEGLYLKYWHDISLKISQSVPNGNLSLCTPAGAYCDSIRWEISPIDRATLIKAQCWFPHLCVYGSILLYIGTRSIPDWQLSCYIASCPVHTCNQRLRTIFVLRVLSTRANIMWMLSSCHAHRDSALQRSNTHTCAHN